MPPTAVASASSTQAKGYWGARSKVLTVAKHHVDKGMQYAYRDRQDEETDLPPALDRPHQRGARGLNGTTYSRLIAALTTKEVDINRKMLADLAVSNPAAFAEVVKFALA